MAHASTCATQADKARFDKILRKRAIALRRGTAESPSRQTAAYLVVVVQKERIAIAADRVRRVFRLAQCTPVPGGPQELLGVINSDGEVRSLLDLRCLLGFASESVARPGYAVLLASDRFVVGFAVDGVECLEELGEEDLNPPGKDLEPARLKFARALGPDQLLILNVSSLMDFLQPAGNGKK